MRKMTQIEFDALPIVHGYRACPGDTDYIDINSFGERCHFGERCLFGGRGR